MHARLRANFTPWQNSRILREEPVTRALQNALGSLPLLGGSAGDGVNFGRTHIYFEGQFHSR